MWLAANWESVLGSPNNDFADPGNIRKAFKRQSSSKANVLGPSSRSPQQTSVKPGVRLVRLWLMDVHCIRAIRLLGNGSKNKGSMTSLLQFAQMPCG